jgi:transcription elongation factor Elf1
MKKTLDHYLTQTLEQLLKREWSSRHLGKYFACPSCGKRFSTKNTFGTHCQGCKLELAITEKRKQMAKFTVSWRDSRTQSITIEASSEEEAREKIMNDEYEEADVSIDNAVFLGIIDCQKS